MTLLKKLPLDTWKRHLVVGDIHGKYKTFKKLLAKANYDPATDIIYSVGDLIDRGNMSFEVLEFFEQDSTHTIMGNHEYMVLNQQYYQTWQDNGGDVCMNSIMAYGKDHEWLKQWIRKLPAIIEVGETDDEHCFRIVHAYVPPSWSDENFQFAFDRMTSIDDYRLQEMMWSRDLASKMKRNLKEMKPIHCDIDFHPDRNRHNFVGHTPIKKVMTVGDVTFLDTFSGRTMSMIDAVTQEVFCVESEGY